MSGSQTPESSSVGLRRLLPAARTNPAPPPAISTTKPITRHTRSQVSAACSTCRKHKVKCSGERPICGRCTERGFECHYTTKSGETVSQARNRSHRDLLDQVSTHAELLELLMKLPDKDAQDVLQRLRAGSDVASVISHVKTGDLLVQMAVQPEVRFRYDLPYNPEMPEELTMNNPYLDSLIYESSSLRLARDRSKQPEWTAANRVADESVPQYQNIYLTPFHAGEVVDPRLTSAKLSSWTNVCENDVLMRGLLGSWLHCEYQFTAAFQKDLFLEDLAAQREDFCSSLLVNVVLGYSCVCYPRFSSRAQYWNPNTLTYRFIAEARRLWDLEADQPKVTTIQAGIIFNVFYNLCGLDAVGQVYRLRSIALAHELRLFDSSVEGLSQRIRHGRAFAAWALFNWETLVGFSFMFAPLLPEPPHWDLPDPVEGVDFYGEIWVRYPLSNRFLPSSFSHIIKARSQFRMIMNECCQLAYGDGSEMSIGHANKILVKLKLWYEGLTEPLLPKAIVLPHHLQLHMYYHHLILTIFEPLLEEDVEQMTGSSARQIVTDAEKHLHTLIRLYYLRHGYEAMDLFIVIPLMLAASECIDGIDAQTPPSSLEYLRSTLILATRGLYNQRRNHYLAEALFRVVRGRMRSSEVALLKGVINMDEEIMEENPDMAQAVRSSWPVSVVKKRDNLDSYILTNLVENFAHLNTEDDTKPSTSKGLDEHET